MARRPAKPVKRINHGNNPRPSHHHDPLCIDEDLIFEKPKQTTHPQQHKRKRSASTNPPQREIVSIPIEIIARNAAQERYLNILNDETNYIVVAMGPAGCGKTFIAVKWAIQQLESGNIKRIVITKPVVSSDSSSLGALPGDILSKLGPWFAPMIDVLKDYYGPKRVTKMMEDEIIVVQPLAMIRGRSFSDSVIIFDEAQSTDAHICRSVMTRIGMGSRVIIMGDINQAEKGFENVNGLKDFVARVESTGSNHIKVCRFSKSDIERHPIIEEVLELYNQ